MKLAARRDLPMVKVEKEYFFEGADGKETLADLFEGRRQLIIYHFMLGPGWEEGCKSCSYLADHFDGANWHLPHRNTTLVVVSRAPLPEIQVYEKRMGWRFRWVSSDGGDFNFDDPVSFTESQEKKNKVYYNYEATGFISDELPGLSVFYKDEDGNVFHTYSTYARGLDQLVSTYSFLDLTPKGATKIRSQQRRGYGGTTTIPLNERKTRHEKTEGCIKKTVDRRAQEAAG